MFPVSWYSVDGLFSDLSIVAELHLLHLRGRLPQHNRELKTIIIVKS